MARAGRQWSARRTLTPAVAVSGSWVGLFARLYPVVFLDAINVKIRDGRVANRPVYSATCGGTVGGVDVGCVQG